MTTTLRTRLAELESAIQGQVDTDAEQQRLGRLRKRAQEIQEAASGLRSSLENAAQLRDQGLEVAVSAPSDGLMNALAATLETTRTSPLELGGDEQPVLLKAVNHYAGTTKEGVVRSWETHKRHHPAPEMDQELFKLASEDDDGLKARWETLEGHLLTLDGKTRPGEGDVARRREVIAEMRGIAATVAERAPAHSVVAFINAAGSAQGAPLTMLDDEDVRAWLAEDGREERFRVRYRR